jgi:hypothetical protein
MADIRELDSIIQIDDEKYSVTAEKVAHSLTINTTIDGEATEITFDGSASQTIDIPSVSDFITESELDTKFKTINGESIVGEGNITITGGGTGGAADTIKVNTDFGDKNYYATITIKATDPVDGVDGAAGDIWFKYFN